MSQRLASTCQACIWKRRGGTKSKAEYNGPCCQGSRKPGDFGKSHDEAGIPFYGCGGCGKPLPGEEQRVAKEQGWEAEAEPATVVAPRKPAVDPAVYYEQLIEDEEEWFREYQAVEDAALNDHLDTPQDHWHEATGPGDP